MIGNSISGIQRESGAASDELCGSRSEYPRDAVVSTTERIQDRDFRRF